MTHAADLPASSTMGQSLQALKRIAHARFEQALPRFLQQASAQRHAPEGFREAFDAAGDSGAVLHDLLWRQWDLVRSSLGVAPPSTVPLSLQ